MSLRSLGIPLIILPTTTHGHGDIFEKQLVNSFELPDYILIDLFIYDKDGRKFVYFGRQLVPI